MTCRTTTEDWATTLTTAAHPLGITREDFTKLLEPFHLRTHDPHHEPRGHCPRDRIISTVTAATGAPCSVETERTIYALVAHANNQNPVTT